MLYTPLLPAVKAGLRLHKKNYSSVQIYSLNRIIIIVCIATCIRSAFAKKGLASHKNGSFVPTQPDVNTCK